MARGSPSGLDKIYPESNKGLARSILNSDGCLISEYPIGTDMCKGYFIDRDRLQSALSKGLIVVSTKVSSGAMHTANFAKGYNRVIGCYYPNNDLISKEEYSGNKKLVEVDGAFKISNSDDIDSFIKVLNESEYSNLELDNKGEQLKFL